ncbi:MULTISPECIES: hypothetical protein [Psychrilyobacter]|uniref:5-bromo-4-chloroindolyl phosphate hydrolysis protein n=1 Tax=Psychrilyobacter piezotolerans TaxID=2293438 RepID=A0ABX9KJD8_9FUSO|nr:MULTISPECIES: hypothetical protein [Psychrilyobacter]MCS5421233.1 hypothetical protein [Psychrilyobacter sp. S5]NDI77010.1 hypothetical protein [Psychrilyobacter piezotolerans]RDE64627.1 hypothetical protein DV867_03540 [Psychrilyobacter sp. S5]REI42439.1 hypothetical protein DYH56_03540 [Psychrilyobacter piezotolerans]
MKRNIIKFICFMFVLTVIPTIILNLNIRDSTTSFFGGYLGGLVAVGGVYWQVTRKERVEKEKKEEDVKNYIKFILNRNFQTFFFHITHRELGLFSRNAFHAKVSNPLINFNQEYINSNINTILSLKNGEKILRINDKIISYSKLFDILFASKKNEVGAKIFSLLLKIKANDATLKISSLNNSIVLFSNLLFYYNNGMVCSPKLKEQFLKNFLYLDLSLKETNDYKNILNKLDIKDLSTSKTALHLLLNLMYQMMTLIRDITNESEKIEMKNESEYSKVMNELEEVSVEIYELRNLFFNISTEISEILTTIDEFFKEQENNN